MTALRGFEAAGRLGSFSKAAEELSMTQSAVSHQVKSLEQFLGQPLFKRVKRRAMLTDAGHEFLGTVRTCIELLEDGVRYLDQFKKPNQVIVSVGHAFASRWLIPRLPRFRTDQPDLDVWLYTTEAVPDFERDEIHTSIWFGDGNWPGLKVEKLFGDEVAPMCAPALLEGRSPVADPARLLDFTLLHDERREDWRSWFTKAGVAATSPVAGPNFSDSGLLLQAAADGQGIALGSIRLAAEDLRAGRLVTAFDLRLPCKSSYYLVCSDINFSRPSIRTFWDWLIAESESDRGAAHGQAGSTVSLGTRRRPLGKASG